MKTTTRAKPARANRLRWVAIVLAVGLVAIAVVWWQLRPASSGLVGAGIVEPQPAANFTLTDQHGQQVSLSSLKGKPIALTFVYTNCTDACPLIASNMHAAYQRLGGDAGKVAMVAVTVDPERDNVAQILQFSQDRGLADEWLFLTGSRAQLQQVWANYGIAAQSVDSKGAVVTPSPDDPETIEHSSPVFLIDKKGDVRALLPIDFAAGDLATDLSRLLAEG